VEVNFSYITAMAVQNRLVFRMEQLVSSMEKQGVERKGHCAQCGVEYVGEDHETSIVHMVNTGHLPSEGYAYGISQSNKGYKVIHLPA
jgi:hypothetical protein